MARRAALAALALLCRQPRAASAARARSVHEHVTRSIVHDGASASAIAAWDSEARNISQPLDHFDPLSTRSWEMRYWVEAKHWSGSGDAPVFLSMGGEGGSGPPGGLTVALAQQYQGLAFSLEHRYYGKSIPTPDFSTPNLRWLGTEQALADAAFFVRKMTSAYNLSSASRWISFGGSYSGELAAWVRIKYPHLIYAAVASSAPVSAIVDYDGYDPIVASALAYPLVGGSPACRDAVASAFATLERKFDSDRPALAALFNTCGEVRTDGDVYLLHDYVSDDFMGLVQYNSDGPNRTNIRSRCRQMLNKTFGATPFDRLVAITRQRSGKRCVFDIDQSGVTDAISFEKHLAGYANATNSERSFPYQMCVDGAGHDQTCKPEKGCIFSHYANRTFFDQQCAAAFGVTAAQTDAAVAFNSANYGDNDPGGSRIVFVNGDIDPFHYGGVTKNSSALFARDITALMVAGGSHCADMGPLNPERDSASMASVKLSKAAAIARWLSESPDAAARLKADDSEATGAEAGARYAAAYDFPACFANMAAVGKGQPWLVQANADYDREMTEGKCLQLCAAKKVLPAIVLQNRGACYCAKALPGSLAPKRLPLSACTSGAGCPGNASESCGTSSAALVIDTSRGLTPVEAIQAQAPKLRLVPYPKTLEYVGTAVVPTSLHIVAVPTLSTEVATLTADLLALNVSASATAAAKLTLRLNSSMQREEYAMEASGSDSWTITGGSSTGVWWGTRTLLQIFAGGGGATTSAVRISSDAPAVEYRSLMTDAARVHLSLDFHLATVKRLSALKMSSYHIHLSDDSGYALPSKAFPNLTSPHLALSLEDWQTLVATAAAYHVELVPEIDLPGHSSWIAKQLPELLGPTCSPGVSWCPIDTSPPALNRTVEIVSQIFEEVFALFKHSRYHHLGADEVYEDPSPNGTYLRNGSTQQHFQASPHGGPASWQHCADCILRGKAGLHAFINRMHRFVKSKGRRTIAWEGFDPDPSKLGQQGVVETIDKDVMVSPFDVAHHDGWDRTPLDYYRQNYSIINSAWAPLYVCPGGALTTPEDMSLWNPALFGGPNAPTPPQSWQRLAVGTEDNWWSPSTQAWAGSTDGWPITSKFAGQPQPSAALPLPPQIHGAEICAWQQSETCLVPLLFAENCTTKGCAGQGRPAPRVAIVAERSWGSATSPADLLERIGCGYS